MGILMVCSMGAALSPNIYIYLIFKFLCGTSAVLVANLTVMGKFHHCLKGCVSAKCCIWMWLIFPKSTHKSLQFKGWSGLIPRSLLSVPRRSCFLPPPAWCCCLPSLTWPVAGGSRCWCSSALLSSFGEYSTGHNTRTSVRWDILNVIVCWFSVSMFFFFNVRYLPESARWLLTQGRKEEAQKELLRAARVNGRNVPENFLEKVKKHFLELFNSSKSRFH